MVLTNGNEIVDAYTNGVKVVEIYSYGVKVWPVSSPSPSPANNEIYYTSSDGQVVPLYNSSGFGVNVVSNTYTNGQGVIKFDGTVTRVGYQAFFGKARLRKVILPSSVEFIGTSSFWDSGLTEINIPEGVTYIYQDAFSETNLRTITIPSTVTNIEAAAFYGCTLLEEVIVNATVPPVLQKSIDYTYAQFLDCSANLKIKVPAASLYDYLDDPGWTTYANYIIADSSVISDTIDFSTLGLVNNTEYYSFTFGYSTITFNGGTTLAKYYTSDSTMRVYNSGQLIIQSTNTIREIEFTWSGNSASYRPDNDYASPSGYSTTTEKWTGSSNSVVMTRPSVSGTWRLKSVTVIYS